jgi:hypothetical protein
MQLLMSTHPRPELRPYVRAYAQRVVGTCDPVSVESVPAQLEQILNFELGVMPGIFHRDGKLTDVALIGGAQTSFSGHLDLRPGVESFAVFFQPAGWTLLSDVPVCELTNRFVDAHAIIGPEVRVLWNRLEICLPLRRASASLKSFCSTDYRSYQRRMTWRQLQTTSSGSVGQSAYRNLRVRIRLACGSSRGSSSGKRALHQKSLHASRAFSQLSTPSWHPPSEPGWISHTASATTTRCT